MTATERPNIRNIDCSLHDHIEVVCLHGYEVELVTRDGTRSRGVARDTKTSEGKEFLLLAGAKGEFEVALHELQSLQVLTPGARFSVLEFGN
ncbi:MAG: Rho-binding antiterminator [Gammaproteobacteria bacterium]|nr:Rho-binding antiterminator [Gammaproteobacteria bacterium]NNF61236.1 transcriptional regulator [Gammaproteobacteria bacterium]NNM20788.1 transcriptional regulator [Gammaproteobacteria bacterium]